MDTERLLEALPVAVYTTDAEGSITFYNQAAAEFWGYRPELGMKWCGSFRLFWPDGSPLPHDECPMAITLKEGREVRGYEAIAERPDGTRVPFVPYPTPLRDASGRVTGAINVLVNVGDRKEAEILAARMAAIVTSSDDAIISKTLGGIVTSWNAGAARIFGYEADEMIGQHITRLIPAELQDEENVIISKLRAGERIDHYETVRVAKDGRRLDISITVSPLRSETGQIIGASKVARDITDKKQTEKLQQLLVEELNHRVKNTLATVQAIANQSLIRAKSQKEFVTSFSGRLQALAKLHTLLTQTNMRGTDLSELIAKSSSSRLSRRGPRLDQRTVPVLGTAGSQSPGHGAARAHDERTQIWRIIGDGGTPRGELGSPNQWRPKVADAMD